MGLYAVLPPLVPPDSQHLLRPLHACLRHGETEDAGVRLLHSHLEHPPTDRQPAHTQTQRQTVRPSPSASPPHGARAHSARSSRPARRPWLLTHLLAEHHEVQVLVQAQHRQHRVAVPDDTAAIRRQLTPCRCWSLLPGVGVVAPSLAPYLSVALLTTPVASPCPRSHDTKPWESWNSS